MSEDLKFEKRQNNNKKVPYEVIFNLKKKVRLHDASIHRKLCQNQLKNGCARKNLAKILLPWNGVS